MKINFERVRSLQELENQKEALVCRNIKGKTRHTELKPNLWTLDGSFTHFTVGPANDNRKIFQANTRTTDNGQQGTPPLIQCAQFDSSRTNARTQRTDRHRVRTLYRVEGLTTRNISGRAQQHYIARISVRFRHVLVSKSFSAKVSKIFWNSEEKHEIHEIGAQLDTSVEGEVLFVKEKKHWMKLENETKVEWEHACEEATLTRHVPVHGVACANQCK
ncbi:unnamed protein product [Anisakis simplex]|uniref:Uncharacterized protein n=1 Tax=Anisakis simplex TaxID=6269 RepID=A0A0M3KCA8_ANISI|nr:unnamed protein product [Anisakis simplex]